MIRLANSSEIETIIYVVKQTIETIYPKYYPQGAVMFFIDHHCFEHVKKDIQQHIVYVLEVEHEIVGTLTLKENEICRLFVLPKHQGKGYGRALLAFAEEQIAKVYNTIKLDSSLPAKAIYLKKGYRETSYHQLDTGYGDYLCYEEMEKACGKACGHIHYNQKTFIPKSNSEHGEVSEQTIFTYYQEEHLFYGEYRGGEIEKGFMIGLVNEQDELDFYYQHVNIHGEVKIGKCHSIPHVLENGKIELYETWQWLNGNMEKGTSIVIER